MPKLLIVGPAWVGDMVMAQSLFRALLQQDPSTEIHVLAPAWSAPLLDRMPEVRRHIHLPLGHGELGLKLRYRLGRQLRTEGYDQAIIIPRSYKAALIPFFARIPRRTGYKGEMRYGLLNDMHALDKSVLTQTVQRYIALGLTANFAVTPVCPLPELSVDEGNIQASLKAFDLSRDAPILALCPGAEYGPAKCWPLEYYAEVAKTKLAEGWQVWIFGSDKERQLGEKIAALAPGCVSLVGRTGLEQAIDLLSLARVVVSNDSGLMHVAAALGRQLVAIYGSSTPLYTPPLSDRAKIQYSGIDCSPCFSRTCKYGHYDCLRGILPEMILESINASE